MAAVGSPLTSFFFEGEFFENWPLHRGNLHDEARATKKGSDFSD